MNPMCPAEEMLVNFLFILISFKEVGLLVVAFSGDVVQI